MGNRWCHACCAQCCPDCIDDENRAFDSPFVDDRDTPEIWHDIPLEERDGRIEDGDGDGEVGEHPQEQIHTITTD
jgi:hypothetical protein